MFQCVYTMMSNVVWLPALIIISAIMRFSFGITWGWVNHQLFIRQNITMYTLKQYIRLHALDVLAPLSNQEFIKWHKHPSVWVFSKNWTKNAYREEWGVYLMYYIPIHHRDTKRWQTNKKCCILTRFSAFLSPLLRLSITHTCCQSSDPLRTKVLYQIFNCNLRLSCHFPLGLWFPSHIFTGII